MMEELKITYQEQIKNLIDYTNQIAERPDGQDFDFERSISKSPDMIIAALIILFTSNDIPTSGFIFRLLSSPRIEFVQRHYSVLSLVNLNIANDVIIFIVKYIFSNSSLTISLDNCNYILNILENLLCKLLPENNYFSKFLVKNINSISQNANSLEILIRVEAGIRSKHILLEHFIQIYSQLLEDQEKIDIRLKLATLISKFCLSLIAELYNNDDITKSNCINILDISENLIQNFNDTQENLDEIFFLLDATNSLMGIARLRDLPELTEKAYYVFSELNNAYLTSDIAQPLQSIAVWSANCVRYLVQDNGADYVVKIASFFASDLSELDDTTFSHYYVSPIEAKSDGFRSYFRNYSGSLQRTGALMIIERMIDLIGKEDTFEAVKNIQLEDFSESSIFLLCAFEPDSISSDIINEVASHIDPENPFMVMSLCALACRNVHNANVDFLRVMKGVFDERRLCDSRSVQFAVFNLIIDSMNIIESYEINDILQMRSEDRIDDEMLFKYLSKAVLESVGDAPAMWDIALELTAENLPDGVLDDVLKVNEDNYNEIGEIVENIEFDDSPFFIFFASSDRNQQSDFVNGLLDFIASFSVRKVQDQSIPFNANIEILFLHIQQKARSSIAEDAIFKALACSEYFDLEEFIELSGCGSYHLIEPFQTLLRTVEPNEVIAKNATSAVLYFIEEEEVEINLFPYTITIMAMLLSRGLLPEEKITDFINSLEMNDFFIGKLDEPTIIYSLGIFSAVCINIGITDISINDIPIAAFFERLMTETSYKIRSDEVECVVAAAEAVGIQIGEENREEIPYTSSDDISFENDEYYVKCHFPLPTSSKI